MEPTATDAMAWLSAAVEACKQAFDLDRVLVRIELERADDGQLAFMVFGSRPAGRDVFRSERLVRASAVVDSAGGELIRSVDLCARAVNGLALLNRRGGNGEN